MVISVLVGHSRELEHKVKGETFPLVTVLKLRIKKRIFKGNSHKHFNHLCKVRSIIKTLLPM